MEVVVEGAWQLKVLSRHLKEAGPEGKGLRKELLKEIRKAVEPAKDAARASAAADLPHRGGLAALIAGSKFTSRTKLGGRDVGVIISARHRKTGGRPGMIALKAMDRGRLRHPVFGNRKVWVTQAVRPGWFTRPMEATAPAVRRDVLDAMEKTAEKIVRRR